MRDNGILYAKKDGVWVPVDVVLGKKAGAWIQGQEFYVNDNEEQQLLWPSRPIVSRFFTRNPTWVEGTQTWSIDLVIEATPEWGKPPYQYEYEMAPGFWASDADGVYPATGYIPNSLVTWNGRIRDSRGRLSDVVSTTFQFNPPLRPPPPVWAYFLPGTDGRSIQAVLQADGYPTEVRIVGVTGWFPLGTENSFTFTGLAPSTAYTLEARNEGGGGYSTTATGQSTTHPIPVPTNLRVLSTTPSSVTIGWNRTAPGTHVAIYGYTGWIDAGVGLSYTFHGLPENTAFNGTLWAKSVDGPYESGVVSTTGATGNAAPPAPTNLWVARLAWNINRLHWADPPVGDLNRMQVFTDGTHRGDIGKGVGYWDFQYDVEFAGYNMGVRAVDNYGAVSGIPYAAASNGEKPWTTGEIMPSNPGASSSSFGGVPGSALDGNFGTIWLSGSNAAPNQTTSFEYWQANAPAGEIVGVQLQVYGGDLTCFASFGILPGGGWNDYGRGTIPAQGAKAIPIWQQRDIPKDTWYAWWFGEVQHCPGGSYGIRLTFHNLKVIPGYSGYRAALGEVRWLYRWK